MAPRVEYEIVLNAEIVDAVHRDCPVEAVVYGGAPDIRLGHGADHVKMDRVLAKLQALPGVKDFNVREPPDRGVVPPCVPHNLDAKLLDAADRHVSGHADVGRKEANLRRVLLNLVAVF